MDAAKFLDELVKNPGYKGQIMHVEDIPARPAVYGELKQPLLPQMREILAQRGIESLYSHQVDAINAVRAGKNIIVVTASASGKTLCYNVPILENSFHDPE